MKTSSATTSSSRNKLHNTYRKRQSVVPSNLQKKAKAPDTHIDKQRLVNTPKMTCKGFGRKVITSKTSCKEKVKLLKYEKSAKKVNPYGLDFPDNFMAIMGWRRTNA